MNKLFTSIGSSLNAFVKDEEGAQIIEYALIIAVVSLALIGGFAALTEDGGGFSTWIARVTALLAGTPAEE